MAAGRAGKGVGRGRLSPGSALEDAGGSAGPWEFTG